MELAIEHPEACNVSSVRKGFVGWKIIRYSQGRGDALFCRNRLNILEALTY